MPRVPIKSSTSGKSGEQAIGTLADFLTLKVKELMKSAKTEEELRIGFEKALDHIRTAFGITGVPRYERHDKATVFLRDRPDAVHGRIVVEYEPPCTLRSERNINHATDQLVRYMMNEAGSEKGHELEALEKLVGIGLDGERIFFIRYRNGSSKRSFTLEEIRKKILITGPYELGEESIRLFLTHLRALSRLPLSPERLAERFGPQGAVAAKLVPALVNGLKDWGTPRITTFFEEWRRLFGIVYGEAITTRQAQESKILQGLYGVRGDPSFQELLFAVHTYFALLMKVLVAELLQLRDTPLAGSFAESLAQLNDSDLKNKISDLEDGGLYARRGIRNFLEGDFFRWYLDAWEAPELRDAIRDFLRAFRDFEPATTTVDPEATRDLLKRLYQYLVPKEIRHDLGEYYTPDWLAAVVLVDVGYMKADTRVRLLDPACGSGTFLVLAIQAAKQKARDEKLPPLEAAKRIVFNIYGFDLNPLAVIASRTNYLFALGTLAEALSDFEIPIYLTDSVLVPKRQGMSEAHSHIQGGFFGENLIVKTSVGEFLIPSYWVTGEGLLIGKAAAVIEDLVRQKYDVGNAMKRFTKEGLTPSDVIQQSAIEDLYIKLFKLEEENRDGIWARFLKNAFAPLFVKPFDFVVGNPPWIRWGYLSHEYREATLPLWKDYGLFSLRGHAARLGGGEKDFSMLFTYAAADHYLKRGGKLGFLITQEVFKSKGAGEGFRRFRLGEDGEFLEVLGAADFVQIQPFEGASNKTAAIFLRKGKQTEYPVPYILWQRKKGVGHVPTDATLHEATTELTTRKRLMARPLGSPVGSWQTLASKQESVSGIEGENQYQARLGARVEPYGVFWLEVKEVRPQGNLIIRNMPEKGKKKRAIPIPAVDAEVESDLVYPAVRGRDIGRWGAKPGISVLLAQDPTRREPYPEPVMKQRWPRTFSYLVRFRDALLARAAYKKYSEPQGEAFYAQYNIGPYTVAHYKVVWQRMASDMIAAVISQSKTKFGYKTIIPTDTTSLIATDSEDEAHFLCAIINSKSVRDFIKSYSSAGRGFGTPSIMQHVGIPKFDPKNDIHKKLAELSKEAHRLKNDGKSIATVEKDINEAAEKLFAK